MTLRNTTEGQEGADGADEGAASDVPPRTDVSELANAVVDGVVVDWQAAESRAAPHSLPVVRAMREVDTILGAHREVLTKESPRRRRPPPLTAGDTWSYLQIHKYLGGGGFGDVYEAFDPRIERATALKLLDAPDDSDEALLQEARLLAKVNHPNVVKVYGAERVDGRVGISMELLEGHTLSDELDQFGTMGADDAVVIGMKLCDALAEVHRQGIVHRDVKAQNVMRASGGRVVLMDFGIGLEESSGDEARPAGTPAYQAPELLAGKAPGVATDLYALGVLLFHLVTADFPVRGQTLREFRERHETGEVKHLRDLRPGLPEAFVQVVEKALEPDPDQRFKSAGAFHRALSRAMESSVLSGGRVRQSGWLRTVRTAVLQGLIWLVVFGGLWWFFRPAPPSEPARVLLTPLADRSNQQIFGESADTALRAKMSRSPIFAPVPEEDEIRASRQMLRPDPGAAFAPQEIEEAALRTESAGIVGGEIVNPEDALQLRLWLEAMNGGRRLAAEVTIPGSTSSSLDDAVQQAVNQLERSAADWMEVDGPLRASPESFEHATTSSLEALRHYTQGVRAYGDGDIDRSEDFMRLALARDPEFALAHLQLGHSVAAQGNPEAAAGAIQRAFQLRERTSSDHERLIISGTYYANARQYRKAIEAYRQVVGIRGDDGTILRQLAIAYRELSDLEEALDYARRGRYFADDTNINRGFFVYMLATAGRAEEALTEAEDAREQKITDYLLLSEALALLILDRPAEALRVTEALAASKDLTYKNLASWMEARVRIYEGQLDRTADILYRDRRTDALEGTDFLEMRRRYWAARLHWLAGRHDVAQEELRRVDLAMIPAHMTGWRSVAVLQAELGDLDSARDVLDRLEGLRAEYPSLLTDLVTSEVRGAILVAEGRAAEAVQALALGEAQSDVSFLRTLSRAHVALGNYQRAADHDQHLIDRRGELLEGDFSGLWVETLVRRARCLEHLGHAEQAAKLWSEARAHWGNQADRAFGEGGPADVLPDDGT